MLLRNCNCDSTYHVDSFLNTLESDSVFNIIHDSGEELSLTLKDSNSEFDSHVELYLSFISIANIIHNSIGDDELNATSVRAILDEHAPNNVDFISRINLVDLMRLTRLLPSIEHSLELKPLSAHLK